MVTLKVIDDQLKQAGCSVRVWGRAEVRELCEILLPGETIHQAVNGQYDAGFAMLVATDFRVLLIDKKPKYLTLKDIRFDMITELDYANRLMDSTVRIYTPNRELRFTAFNSAKLRKLFTHTQHKVMEIRHHFMMQQFQNQQLAANTPPGLAMTNQRYGQVVDGEVVRDQISERNPEPAHFYQGSQQQQSQHADSSSQHHVHESTEEQLKLAAAMGAAGLRSIVHNGRVIKDYMTVPFTQRWHKRPYGYTKTPVSGQAH
jgi:hypothetical protein